MLPSFLKSTGVTIDKNLTESSAIASSLMLRGGMTEISAKAFSIVMLINLNRDETRVLTF